MDLPSVATRFHRSVQENDVETVERFFAFGFDGNEPDWENNGKIALLEATRLSNVQMVQTLLANGCSPNARDCQGQTALHVAVKNPNTALINALLAAGASPTLSDTLMGMSPLHLLVQQAIGFRSHVERALFVNVMLEIIPKCDVDGAMHSGDTALHLASKGPSVAVIKALLDGKADVNCRNARGETPLMVAIVCNQVNIAKMILNVNCDLDVRDRYHQTALHYAANLNCVDVVDGLLLGGCDINAVDLNGDTALHLAAGKGHGDVIRLILKCGNVTKRIKNGNGKRAVDVAVESRFWHLKKLFRVEDDEGVVLRHPEKVDADDGFILHGCA